MASRRFSLESKLGDALLFALMEVREQLGQLFEFRLECLHPDVGLNLPVP